MAYNPFGKPLGSQLSAADLEVLKQEEVSEGYYVEYKREFPNPSKIGRSLASFANTNSGWYFVGIETDHRQVATNIVGIDLSEDHDPIAKVRDVARYHLQPVPLFFPQLVDLGNARAVLAVYIPDDQDTPIISKDGRIYRRTADCSEPVHETDRHALDRLVERGRQSRAEFADLCEDTRTLSNGEGDQGWIGLYFAPYPDDMAQRTNMLSESGVEDLRALTQIPMRAVEFAHHAYDYRIYFNAGHQTDRSVVIRQSMIAGHPYQGVHAEFFTDGHARFFIPISQLHYQDIRDRKISSPKVLKFLNSTYPTLDELSEAMSSLIFFDVDSILVSASFLASLYLKWIGEDIRFRDVRMAVTTEGMYRRVPYSDCDAFGEVLLRSGLPIPLQDSRSIPPDLSRPIVIANDDIQRLPSAVARILCQAFGLPGDLQDALLVQGCRRLGLQPTLTSTDTG